MDIEEFIASAIIIHIQKPVIQQISILLDPRGMGCSMSLQTLEPANLNPWKDFCTYLETADATRAF